jgi:hypothetical protein
MKSLMPLATALPVCRGTSFFEDRERLVLA